MKANNLVNPKKGTVYCLQNKHGDITSSCHNTVFIITKDITEDWKRKTTPGYTTNKTRRFTLISGSDHCKNNCFDYEGWGCINFVESLVEGKTKMHHNIITIHNPEEG